MTSSQLYMLVSVCVCALQGISQTSWTSDRAWQRTQQGVVLLLSDAGSCLDSKHPADWLNEPLLHSRIRDDAESVPLWHSKQKQLQVIWVYKERPLGKLWRNQLETAEKSRKENSFSATTLTPLSSNPNTSTLLPTTLQNRAETPDDSWLLSKVSGSQALQPPQLYKHLAGSSRLFPQLEGKHQKWWVER